MIEHFLQKVVETYNSGHAREHSYRPALKELFESVTGLKVINEPKRSEYGAPDFVFLKGKIVIAYAEAKDINVSLDDIEKSEQMDRYYGYSNIILTNGLEFRFYRNAARYVEPVAIGQLENESIKTFEQSFKLLEDTIGDFIKESKEPIKSGGVLAKVMAGKARRIRDNVKKFLADSDNPKNENLLSIYEVVKKLLLADLDKNKFADMYAQTLVYGLFVARYYDKTPDNFTRAEARDLVPASNPFLREFFNHVAGSSFDSRIEFIVTELCEEFNHADVGAIVHDYYKVDKDGSRDPIIHFYEDFLQEYDSNERKKMGVFYTPLPVARFIIRSVDDILKKEFGLAQGLADASKIEVKKEAQGKKAKVLIHKVQVLDPAIGTGTFLNEAILHIRKSFAGQEGRWNQYVNNDLLPRLHGFELMMASYTIAHLKLSTTIRESGAKIENARLGVYLTNSLEKGGVEELNLFSSIGLGKAIAEESNQANKVKNDLPIMVIIGNPPYSVSSQNKSEWIQDLIKNYKKDLGERKINLDDDYIKFIRFAEHFIEKNGSGVVGMITNNSFIDGITHRQMRKHLLETFDSIYIVDLHGNSKKKEKAPDGGKDENVFNIMQGVSIILGVKTGKKKLGLGAVYHAELYGKREDKFAKLDENNLDTIKWNKLEYLEPYYFFVPKDFGLVKEYERGFKIDELFGQSGSGVITRNDDVTIKFDAESLSSMIRDFRNLDELELRQKYQIVDGASWKLNDAKKDIIENEDKNRLSRILYRPFDFRYTLFTQQSGGFLNRPVFATSGHLIRENVSLITARIVPPNQDWNRILVSNAISDIHSISDQTYVFPLYLYADDGSKVPNLKKEIVAGIEKIVGKVSPEDILDYIYAVLHSPSYREKYKEFLKIDFPRVPYPQDAETFKKLVSLGKELRELHLLESSEVNQFITNYPESGSDTVEKKYPKFENGKVWINDKQYFGNVPEVAWNFYIGGYQPAQKWLKDRQGRVLTNSDIEHYQKIIVALTETGRIMIKVSEINTV